MKTLFQFIIVLTIFSTSFAQQQNIETKSVVIENLISFMVDEYSISSDSIPKHNITFLIDPMLIDLIHKMA